MTARRAAAEYLHLAKLAADTDFDSVEWKTAIAFAHRFEESATEESFDEYLDNLEYIQKANAEIANS